MEDTNASVETWRSPAAADQTRMRASTAPNIRDRVGSLGAAFELASNPGGGTPLTFALRWPTRADSGQ
jgi:hypothetical protein